MQKIGCWPINVPTKSKTTVKDAQLEGSNGNQLMNRSPI